MAERALVGARRRQRVEGCGLVVGVVGATEPPVVDDGDPVCVGDGGALREHAASATVSARATTLNRTARPRRSRGVVDTRTITA